MRTMVITAPGPPEVLEIHHVAGLIEASRAAGKLVVRGA